MDHHGSWGEISLQGGTASFLMVTCGKELAGCFLPPKLGDPRESTRMIWGAMREDFVLFIIRSLLGGLVGEMAQWVEVSSVLWM